MSKQKKQPLPPACRTCNWTGQVYKRVTMPDGFGGSMEVDAQAFCDCPRGVLMRQGFDYRKARQAELFG